MRASRAVVCDIGVMCVRVELDHSADRGPAASRTVTKPVLVAVSHAIEEFALASTRDRPMAAVGLFQRAAYFVPQREVWARIAEIAGDAALIALAGAPPTTLPADLGCVSLGQREPLSREWSLTVLTPRTGATLVAHDLETVDGSALSLERGRMFTARWSFQHADAHGELQRLRRELGPQLDQQRTGALDDVLSRVVPVPGTAVDGRGDAAVDRLVRAVSIERRRADAVANQLAELEPGAERDPRSGLATRAFLDRWTEGSATGTLPLGLVLLRVRDLGLVHRQHGFRAETAVLQSVARLLRRQLGGAGRAVRVGREEFLLVLPGLDVRTTATVAQRLCDGVAELSAGYPFVPTPCTAVITRTRIRPLPVDALWAALDDAVAAGRRITLLRL